MGRTKNKTKAAPAVRKDFYDKLVLNLFLINLFGINVFNEYRRNNQIVRPFRRLTEKLENCSAEGLADDGLHHFYHEFSDGDFFDYPGNRIPKDQLLEYEKNIVELTEKINASLYISLIFYIFFLQEGLILEYWY